MKPSAQGTIRAPVTSTPSISIKYALGMLFPC
jgi:hypothetical protein